MKNFSRFINSVEKFKLPKVALTAILAWIPLVHGEDVSPGKVTGVTPPVASTTISADATKGQKIAQAKTLFRFTVTDFLAEVSPKFKSIQNKLNYFAPAKTVFSVIKREPHSEGDLYIVALPQMSDDKKGQPAAITSADCESKGYVCLGQAYSVSVKDIDGGYGLIKDSLVSGVLVIPFKYFPHDHTFSTNSLTLGPYFGRETEFSLINLGLVQKYTYFISFGPTIISVASGEKTTNVFALSAAVGFAYDINDQIKFLLASGKDWTGSSATTYKYNALPWVAVTLGYSF